MTYDMAQRAALVDQRLQWQNLNQLTSQQCVHFVLFVRQPENKTIHHSKPSVTQISAVQMSYHSISSH